MLQQIVSNTAILKERFFRFVSIRTTNLVEGRPVTLDVARNGQIPLAVFHGMVSLKRP